MTLSFIGLIAANAVLLLLIALGLVAIVLSERAERRTVVVVVVAVGLSPLLPSMSDQSHHRP